MVTFFCLFMFLKGIFLTSLAWDDTAVTLNIPKGLMYLALPVGAALTIIANVINMITLSKQRQKERMRTK